jgi:hypothetical protein
MILFCYLFHLILPIQDWSTTGCRIAASARIPSPRDEAVLRHVLLRQRKFTPAVSRQILQTACICHRWTSLLTPFRSVAGWQFVQRGWIKTFAASVNSARERADVSGMDVKAEGRRNSTRSFASANPRNGKHNFSTNDQRKNCFRPHDSHSAEVSRKSTSWLLKGSIQKVQLSVPTEKGPHTEAGQA